MPGQALRLSGDWGSEISRQSAHESVKVVSPILQPPLPQEIFLIRISVKGLSRTQDHSAAGRMSMKNFIDTIGDRTSDLPVLKRCAPIYNIIKVKAIPKQAEALRGW